MQIFQIQTLNQIVIFEQLSDCVDDPSTSSDEDELPLAQVVNGGSNLCTNDNDADDEIPLAQMMQPSSSQAKPSLHTFMAKKAAYQTV